MHPPMNQDPAPVERRVLPTIADRLHLLVLASILPMWLLALALTYAFDRFTQEEELREAEQAGQLLLKGIDADLSVGLAALHVLAESPLIDDGDWRRVYAQALSVRDQQEALNVFVMKPDMQVQISLDRPFGAPTPRLPHDRLPSVFAQGRAAVSDRFVGSVAPEPLVSLGVPVKRQGAVIARVEMVMKLARFSSVVSRAQLPAGWGACLLDGQRQVITRSASIEAAASVGAPGGPAAAAACSVDGPTIRSGLSSWAITLHPVPDAGRSPLLRMQFPLALGALCLLAVGWLLARRLARGIAAPIQALVQPALAIGRGEPAVIAPGGLRETGELAQALDAAQALLARREQARAAADAARQESEARLDLALEAAGVGDWALEPERNAYVHSARHDQCYGHAEPVPQAQLEDFDRQLHPDDRDAVLRSRQAAIEAGTPWRDEYRVLWPDGTQHWLSVRARCFGAKTDTRRLVGVVADVTERRDMASLALKRSELEMENRQLQTLIEQRNRFFASMSHELRTPLNAVIGLSDLLLQTSHAADAATQRRYIEHIATAGRDLLALVNDMLDLGKAEAGRLIMRPSLIELRPFCAETVELLRPLGQRRGIAIRVNVEPGVGSAYLDPLRLRQILYNLLSNAVKFSPADAAVTLRVASAGPGLLRFEVEDAGPGIPVEQQGRLFGVYEQLDSGQAMSHLGTGLGLALTRQLVELHCGQVSVRSAAGRGSTFIVELPASVAGAETSPA
jgi:signal transduction histidine kinase